METIWMENGEIMILDQTELPSKEVVLQIDTVERMAEAIEKLRVRGAPLIGVSAAYGLALAARNNLQEADFITAMRRDADRLRRTRPTAVNLFWAIDRCMVEAEKAYAAGGAVSVVPVMYKLADAMKAEDIEINRKMGAYGAELIDDGDGVLTHCNAGALATAGHGTALGVFRSAWEQGKKIHVYADETRPLLQGSRLTCWELMKDGIPVSVQADNMAGVLMRDGKIQKIVVGADRIAANGDTANKIGTYSVACLAKMHGIPFYIAAPLSTIDRKIKDGSQIPIEYRNMEEMRFYKGAQTAPADIEAYNPAFDVTPNALISGIITEKGVLKAPFTESIAEIFR